jgi:PAS domain S-box-containing protein
MDNVEQTIRKGAYELWERAGRPDGRSHEFWLQAVEAQLRVMIDHAPAAVAMFDRDMRYVNVSKRWLSDYSLNADVIGRSHYDVFPEAPESWREIQRRALDGEVVRSEEDRFARKSGAVQWLRWEARPWRMPSGEIAGIIIFSEDITRRKRVEEELARACRLESLGRLTAGFAHDFNNLLTVLAGNLELILQSAHDDYIRGLARPALEAAETGAFLNRRLLSLGRKRRTSVLPVNLNDRISETFGLFQRAVGQQISIQLDLAAELWLAVADPAEIDSALINIVLNSRDAMPNGGEITILTRNQRIDEALACSRPGLRASDFVCLVVADNGEGMTEDVLRRALEPFFTTKLEGNGAGLGLSTVDAFVKEAGGFVTIESRPGVGTTVTLSLPRAVEDGTVSRPTARSDDTPRGNGEIVLVVEDDDRVREVTLKRVEALGYVAEEARSAAEARARLMAGGVDIVLSDIVMERAMDGVDLARWMSVNQPSVPIVLATAFPGGAGYAELRRTRHAFALIKPYSRKALAAALSRKLSRAGAHCSDTSRAKT